MNLTFCDLTPSTIISKKKSKGTLIFKYKPFFLLNSYTFVQLLFAILQPSNRINLAV